MVLTQCPSRSPGHLSRKRLSCGPIASQYVCSSSDLFSAARVLLEFRLSQSASGRRKTSMLTILLWEADVAAAVFQLHPGSELKHELYARPETFGLNTRKALRYYGRCLDVFNRVYALGAPFSVRNVSSA